MLRKTLLISNYNTDLGPWNGGCYEFFRCLYDIEDATVVANPPIFSEQSVIVSSDYLKYGRSVVPITRQILGGRTAPRMQASSVEDDYDLCVFMCQFPRHLPEVEQVRHWRERSRFAVAYLLESWSGELDRHRADLRILDKFDHVCVMNASAIPRLRHYTQTPISFLPTAADALAACPHPANPPRVVDVLSLGRRLPEVHEALLELARARGLYYVFDLWKNLQARDWAQVREANAGQIMRSRYFVAWDPVRFDDSKAHIVGRDRALSTRYFEAAAGGAVIVGSRVDAPEFEALFDWPDAVIELDPEGRDLAERLDELDADIDRTTTIRTHNVVNSLRRHDWVYRWDAVLGIFGMPRTLRHQARVAELDRRACQVEAANAGIGWQGLVKA